MAYINSFLFNL